MAVVNLCGFEAGDTTETQSVTGTVSVQSSIKRTGDYALQVNPTTTGSGFAQFTAFAADGRQTTSVGVNNQYVRFYLYIATLPASAGEEIYQSKTGSNLTKMTVRITSAGKLQAYDNTGTVQMGSDGGTTLSTGIWYRIEVLSGTGVTANWEIRINGTTELSGTGDLTASGTSRWHFGKATNRNGQSVDFYYDDIVIDDTTWPGPGQIIRMDPDGDGNYTAWTIGAGGGADWTNVDDVPHDSDTTYLTSAVSGNAETVTLESAASAGISGTIKCVKGMVIVRDEGGAAASTLRVRANSTDSDTTAANLSTAYVQQAKLLETDPSDAGAWTVADLDTLEIGDVLSAAVATRMTLACAMVDFEPAPPVAVPGSMAWLRGSGIF